MKKLISAFVFVLFSTVFAVGQSKMTNDDVIALVSSGLSPTIIAAKIRSSEPKFDTSTEGLKKLAEAKVPDSVIVAMLDRDGEEKAALRKEAKESAKSADLTPEQGTLADLKGKTKVYIMTADLQARAKIEKELGKKQSFIIVDSVEKSDFVMKYEGWSEAIGATANVFGGSSSASIHQARIGLLTVALPSETANRIRLVYTKKDVQRSAFGDNPAESTTKEFLKALAKIDKKSNDIKN